MKVCCRSDLTASDCNVTALLDLAVVGLVRWRLLKDVGNQVESGHESGHEVLIWHVL